MDIRLDNKPLRWLYLDLNSYFASVEQQLQPRLRGRPVVVAPVMTDSTCAIAASYEAKAFGVRTGTPIHEAKRLCPGLVIVPARHDEYVRHHHAVIAAVNRCLPVTKICSIDEVACQLMDNENAPERAMAIARIIKQAISEDVGPWLKSSIGIAPNRYLAKVASNMHKPDGLTVIDARELPDRLRPLPLRALPGIGAKMEARLRAAGLTSVSSLVDLAPNEMLRLWGGAPGARLWWRLHGMDFEDRERTGRSIGHSHVLPPELRRQPAARIACRRLVLKVGSRLRQKDMRTAMLVLGARFVDRSRWAMTEKLAPTQDSAQLIAVFERLWHRLENETGGMPILKTGVTLLNLSPAEATQPDLFDERRPEERSPSAPARTGERNLKLWGAIDQLNQKHGKDAVRYGFSRELKQDRFSGTKIAFTRIPEMSEFHQ